MGNTLSILELFPSITWAGPEQHIFDLVTWFTANGHKVNIATHAGTTAERFECLCKVHELFDPGAKRISAIRIPGLVRLIKTEEVDIVHCHGGYTSWIAMIATRLAGRGKVVNTWHGFRSIKKDPLHSWFYRNIDAIICVSDRLRDKVVAANPVTPSERIQMVHNGIDVERFSAGGAQGIRSLLDIPEDAFLVGCFGRVHPEKGVEYAVGAVELLKQQGTTAYLIIVGREEDSAYVKKMKEYIADHCIGAQIKFCGFTPEVPKYIGAIDALIFPSVCEESCPLVLCEAMAAGKPIVTTGLGAQAEIVEDGKSGFIVEAFSAEAIAEKVQLLFGSPGLRAEIGTRGRQAVGELFSLATMGKNTERVFWDVLARNG